MGTNYKVVENICECCNRHDEKYHIGKDSYGWAFTFQGYAYDELTSWKKWKEFLKDQVIMNEYDDRVSYEEFVSMIETYKAPGYVNPVNGHQNLVHNEEGRRKGWFNPKCDWDDEDGYSFCSREFS